MSKNFWNKCMKRFFLITIPTLIAIITLFSIFSQSFENALKNFGIFGAVIICLFCFSVTLLYGVNEMIDVVDIIDEEYSKGKNSNERIIYNFYNSYYVEKRNSKKDKRNDLKTDILSLCKPKKEFANKYITFQDLHNDALQEVCFTVMETGVTSMCTYIDLPILSDVPSIIPQISIVDLREKLAANKENNVLVRFCGEINGMVLLCFSGEFEKRMETLLDGGGTVNANNYNYYLRSFLYEAGSLFAGSCLTSLINFLQYYNHLQYYNQEKCYKLIIKNIKVNVDYSHLTVPNASESVFITKLENRRQDGGRLFTSYIMFDKSNIDYLLDKVYGE